METLLFFGSGCMFEQFAEDEILHQAAEKPIMP